MTYDPIPDIASLGYTWREAAFLHLVGTNSGFFLYRQYCDFINRKLGALAQRLVQKGVAYGHIAILDYGQRRHVYHVKSRTIYRIIGNANSDHHRPKGDVEIKTRLMVLDYLLANRKERFLTTEQEKLDFFVDWLRLSKSILPSSLSVESGRAAPIAARYFPERFPIHAVVRATGKPAYVRFPYFDYGASSVKRFARFLETCKPLLEELGTFGVVYVADSPRNFADAERAFERTFPRTSRLLPLGYEHIASFLEAQARWDRNDPTFSPEDLATLKEGERIYIQAEHAELHKAWLKSRRDFDTQLARLGEKQLTQGAFTSHILHSAYPIFGHRYRGKAPTKAMKPQFGSSSNFNSIAS